MLTAIRFSSSSSPPSSSQALADLAAFHAYATAENNEWGLGTANKWVSFGGSYPGMLAGWSRLKYPELIHAAVASSAPVHAKLDMREYNDITAEVRSSSFFSPCPVDPDLVCVVVAAAVGGVLCALGDDISTISLF